MKILIQSCVFSPSVGGTETATRLLAIGLQDLGHEVKVITDTEGDSPYTRDLDVHRRPGTREFLGLMRWCDVYVQSNISLRNLWPLLIYWRPWIIVHHTRYETDVGPPTFLSKVKQACSSFATNLTVSQYMADHLRSPSVVVKNPYADDVFHPLPGVVRQRDLLVVGRLNEDKGFQIAIEALYRLHQRGRSDVRMTLVGEGPHRDALQALALRRSLEGAIDFTGVKQPEDLARAFNAHRILIVPSLTSETFGLVAVEGMACGCLVVGSDLGGLRETIGPCGLTFPAGDVVALTGLIERLLEHPEALDPYLQAAPQHLAQFYRGTIIPSYADFFRQTLRRWKGEI